MASWQIRADQIHQAIKTYYEKHNGQNWPSVSADPRLFNRVWRRMLRLPDSDGPPPVQWRT